MSTVASSGVYEEDITTTSLRQTTALAARIARAIRPPLVIELVGDLGAGKTTFVRAFVHALAGGRDVVVQSPTFALARSYDTTPRVHHFDLYRLQDGADESSLRDLGLLDQLEDEDAISLVEWPLPELRVSVPVGRIRIDTTSARRRRWHIALPAIALVDAGEALALPPPPVRAPRAT